jgi:hypothetical protein
MTFLNSPITVTVTVVKVNAPVRVLNAKWTMEVIDDVMKSKSKYKFSRAKWFESDKWGHTDVQQMRDWCIENFGPKDTDPNAWSRWSNNYNSFFRFRDEADYILFTLRWGA